VTNVFFLGCRQVNHEVARFCVFRRCECGSLSEEYSVGLLPKLSLSLNKTKLKTHRLELEHRPSLVAPMTDDTSRVLFCLIEGDSRPFKVTPNKGDILDLKKLIQGVLRNVDAKDLVLWKVGLFNNLNIDSLTLSAAPQTRSLKTQCHYCRTHTVTRH
jgi:Crinkler effector protein N-terminal domain